VAKADNKPIDYNQINLTESSNLFVKARDLWFTVIEPASMRGRQDSKTVNSIFSGRSIIS
jgi:hypothetical protein